MRPALLLATVLLVAALAGCTEAAPTASPAPSGVSTSASPSESATPSPSPTTSVAPDSSNASQFFVDGWYGPADVFFVSPSKNLRCGIFSPVDGVVRWGCNAIERTWEFASEKPGDPCYDAQIPCGFGVEGFGDEVPGAMSHSDVSYASEYLEEYAVQALGYGETVTYAGVSCSSAEDGVTCINTASGHGFTVSKSRKDVF